MTRAAAPSWGGRSAGRVGVDTRGADFGLLDREDRLLGNPVPYRDARTAGMLAAVSVMRVGGGSSSSGR